MKSFTILVLVAALASAQGITDLPSCSLTCIVNAVSETGCGTTDFQCSCSKSDQLTASVTPCVESACGAGEQAKVVSVLEGICAGAGVPISIPTPEASSAAPATSAPVTSVAAASFIAVTSAAAAVSTSGSLPEIPAGSSYCGVSTVYTTVTAGVSSVVPSSAPSVGTGSPMPNGTYTMSAYPSQFTGAGNANAVPMGVAGFLAAVAYML